MSASFRMLVLLIAGVAVISQSGCISLHSLLSNGGKSSTIDTTMLKMQGYSIPPGGMPSPVAPNTSDAPRFVLEVRGEKTHLESIPMPNNRAMFVEDLVKEARLHERLGGLNISIMRPNGPNNPPVRLDTQTDSKGKIVNAGSNYALLPNDHLIVHCDERSGLEKFIDKRFSK